MTSRNLLILKKKIKVPSTASIKYNFQFNYFYKVTHEYKSICLFFLEIIFKERVYRCRLFRVYNLKCAPRRVFCGFGMSFARHEGRQDRGYLDIKTFMS